MYMSSVVLFHEYGYLCLKMRLVLPVECCAHEYALV